MIAKSHIIKNTLLLALCWVHGFCFVQNDSLYYELFPDQQVIDASLGYNTAPFRITDEFGLNNNQLKYRANMNPVLGIGFSYKWLSLGVSLKLPGYIRDTLAYGTSNYVDLDIHYQWNRWYFTGDIHWYKGFSLRDANRFVDGLEQDNLLNENLRSHSISGNAFYFLNEKYQIKPANGIVGRYRSQAQSLFLKNTFNVHGINGRGRSILPHNALNGTPTIWESTKLGAVDFGFVPGWAYVNNINDWQFGFRLGAGGVIQAKYYQTPSTTRIFLGLAPRYDLNFLAGYNTKDWFLMLQSNVDNKSVRFNDYHYRQVYYFIRLSGGIRF